jgi:hypothetical protein
MGEARWFKSSYSGNEGSGACVETSIEPGVVHVRNSTDPHGPMLKFTPEAWASFVSDPALLVIPAT